MKTEEEIKKMKTEDKSDWRCGQEWPSEEVIFELRKYVTIRNGVLGQGEQKYKGSTSRRTSFLFSDLPR